MVMAMESKYQLDVSYLEQIKQYLLTDEHVQEPYRSHDLVTINELIRIAMGKKEQSYCTLKEKIQYVLDSMDYRNHKIDSHQLSELKQLQKIFKYMYLKSDIQKKEFEMEELFSLFEEFLDWFPSKKIGKTLKDHYHQFFYSHFHYCHKTNQLQDSGCCYLFTYIRIPFMVIGKDTFIESFITLVHEMGHVLIKILDLEPQNSECRQLFAEIDGRYFEYLATQFLLEKTNYQKDVIINLIGSHNMIKSWLSTIKHGSYLESFLKNITVKEMLCEVYSYLGMIDLSNRYHGDYEKQLFDLISILSIHSNDMDEYIKLAQFRWREDQFQSLKDHNAWLKKQR